jgi:non-heme chloroperoxidase
MMTQTPLLAATELSRIQFSIDFRTELKRIEVATLVVHGDRDASAPLAFAGHPTANMIGRPTPGL